MITSQEKQNGISVIHVKKEYTDEEMERRKNTLITRKDIKLIITEDTDVYSENNKLLLKFRRNKINKKCIGDFYTNVIGFAKKSYSTNRGSVSASNAKNVLENPKVFSNVIGFMDNFSPKQKYLLKQRGKTVKYNVRERGLYKYYCTINCIAQVSVEDLSTHLYSVLKRDICVCKYYKYNAV